MTKKNCKMKTYYILFLLLVQLTIVGCSDSDNDYSTPDLDLVLATEIETNLDLPISEELLLNLDFENAEGNLSYKWFIDDEVVSEEDSYLFKGVEVGQFIIKVYIEDTVGKFANIEFKLNVTDNDTYVYNGDKLIIGYNPSYRTGDVKWNRITHLLYAYIYPKLDGTLDVSEMEQLSEYVADAQINNTKILVSLGGTSNYPGREDRVFTEVIKDNEKRANLIQSILAFIEGNDLDGINIHYSEFVGGGENVDNLETNLLLPFYQEAREVLPENIVLTASVTGSYGWTAYHFRDIAAEMSTVLDFISVLSYDNTGVWEESPLGHHSSVIDAQNALNRYVEFGIPSAKLVLGVPFYGRDFLTSSGGIANALTYADILNQYTPTESELTEGNINREGHNIFFESQHTISQKSSFINENQYRGMTIWELGQDTNNRNLSLLSEINNHFD